MELMQVFQIAGALRDELAKVIIGQETAIDHTLASVIAGGHILLEGPPGTAKTLLARTLCMAINGQFNRVQFTPDLMPADIVGVSVYTGGDGRFNFHKGPVFCDLLLADEINRAPAKTQSALLEAMQEAQVTVDGQNHPLSPVFTVIATQNPIEYEGTYPLPEAQLDRFMLKIRIDYPHPDAENLMLKRHHEGFDPSRLQGMNIQPPTDVHGLMAMRAAARTVHAVEKILNYITAIVRGTRTNHLLTLGASPRAAVMLLAASKASAILRGRDYVTPDDVRDMTAPCLRHRVVLTAEAEIEGVSPDQALNQILDRIEVPRI